MLQHSEVDYIFIPSNRPRVKELTHISISVDIKNHRIIKGPKGNILILDGLKKLKVCYLPESRSKRTLQVELYLPYNTHLELPDEVKDIDNVDIYIGDAYFELIEGRKIYSFVFYILDVQLKSEQSFRKDLDEKLEAENKEIPENALKENTPPPLDTAEDFLTELQKALLPLTSNEAEFSFEDDLDESNYDEEKSDDKTNGET